MLSKKVSSYQKLKATNNALQQEIARLDKELRTVILDRESWEAVMIVKRYKLQASTEAAMLAGDC